MLLAPENAEAALGALLAELRVQVPNLLGLDLKAVRQNSPVWNAIQGDVGAYASRRGLRSMYSFLDVKGDFNRYLAGLGNMRKNLRAYRRKLESRGRVLVDLRKGAAADAAFLPEYLALEASGWKGRNGTAMVSDPGTVAFYKTLIENFASQGRWEWHTIRVDERIVAAEMGVRCGSSLILLKYAFDEDFADCRPGHLLTEAVFKDAFERPEIDEINHMSFSSSDHHWRMSQDEYVDAHLVRRDALPILLQLPGVAVRSAYQNHVRPRIPAVVKDACLKFKRRGDPSLAGPPAAMLSC